MSSAPPDTDLPRFDREAYRQSVQEQLHGLPREKQVAIAARAAWRVIPLMFIGWRDRDAQRQWWERFGTGITSKLVMALCYEVFRTQVERNAAYAAASAAAASSASVSSSSAAYAYAAAYAAADAAYVTADTADAAAYGISYAVAADLSILGAGSHEFMVDEVQMDLQKARSGREPLDLMPLWSRSAPGEFLQAWRSSSEQAMRYEGGAEQLNTWLVIYGVEGTPPLEDMRRWFNDWWLKHPDNKDRVPAFKDFAEPASSSKRPKGKAKTASPPSATPPPIIEKIYKEPTYSVALASDGVAQTLTDTAEKCKEALRAFLACPDTQAPITVSVEAPWGAGKTSFLHCLRGSLEKQNLIPTVWFNPWKHEAGKTLWAAFAVAYERQMAEKLSWPGRWRRRVVLSWQRLFRCGASAVGNPSAALAFGLGRSGVAVHAWCGHGDEERLGDRHEDAADSASARAGPATADLGHGEGRGEQLWQSAEGGHGERLHAGSS